VIPGIECSATAARESSGNTGKAFENLLDVAASLSLKTK
jgi:hypothetical protein